VEEPGTYVAGWGTLSLINAGLAQGKGHRGFEWWLASLFLGSIATFLIAVLPRIAALVPEPQAIGRGRQS
jgi:hypothetical protein